jgi:hypothetical protein
MSLLVSFLVDIRTICFLTSFLAIFLDILTQRLFSTGSQVQAVSPAPTGIDAPIERSMMGEHTTRVKKESDMDEEQGPSQRTSVFQFVLCSPQQPLTDPVRVCI